MHSAAGAGLPGRLPALRPHPAAGARPGSPGAGGLPQTLLPPQAGGIHRRGGIVGGSLFLCIVFSLIFLAIVDAFI